MGDIMMHVGEYYEYRGVFSTVEGNLWYLHTPMVLNTPTVLMISPTCIMISTNGTQIAKVHHGTEHPHGTHDIPMCILICLLVLSIPHGTQDNPHSTHVIPHVTEHPTPPPPPPTVLKIFPHLSLYSPTVLNILHGTQDSPLHAS